MILDDFSHSEESIDFFIIFQYVSISSFFAAEPGPLPMCHGFPTFGPKDGADAAEKTQRSQCPRPSPSDNDQSPQSSGIQRHVLYTKTDVNIVRSLHM